MPYCLSYTAEIPNALSSLCYKIPGLQSLELVEIKQ